MKFRWTKYTLPNGREVFLTNRPDVIEDNSLSEWLEKEEPLVRFSFTDDFVEPPKFSPPWHWLPWVPGKDIVLENVFAFICMMDRYQKKAYAGPIWLHCDSSTMRAPTYFGLFLKAIYPDKAKEICDNFVSSSDVNGMMGHYARPDAYADISFNSDPGISDLIKVWSQDGEKAAYKIYMKEEV